MRVKKGKQFKKRRSESDLSLIKDHVVLKRLDNQSILNEDYPIFCFKYLSKKSIENCQEHGFFYGFLMRLQKLSNLGWAEIRLADRHGFGMESIPKSMIIPQLPQCVTPEVEKLHVFRANGNNLPFIGLQVEKIFRVFFIEAEFGDIYNHQ